MVTIVTKRGGRVIRQGVEVQRQLDEISDEVIDLLESVDTFETPVPEVIAINNLAKTLSHEITSARTRMLNRLVSQWGDEVPEFDGPVNNGDS